MQVERGPPGGNTGLVPSGERVSNTWVTYPRHRDKPGKLGLIPDMSLLRMVEAGKGPRSGMGPRPISLLVG
jgi:hypothetical protein